MQSYKLYICERHFTPNQIYVYPTRKMLKEGALPTLNLPRESASNTRKPRPANAIEKREEYQLLQEQMPQPVQSAYKSFKDFTSRIKSLALTKSWKVEVKEQLVVVSQYLMIRVINRSSGVGGSECSGRPIIFFFFKLDLRYDQTWYWVKHFTLFI